jgi:nucleoside-diphosphate-sugar epimerase
MFSNGLIASHVVDQLMWAGYNIRGTVRTPEKCAWMEPLYSKRHGPGRFELIQVADFDAPGAWDAAVKGVAGIAHVAGPAEIGVYDVEQALEKDRRIHKPLLEAAKKETSVKSFVLTSSAWAAWTPDMAKKVKLTEASWNEEAIKLAASDAPPEERVFASLMATKTRMEQEFWEWIKKEKPAFTFNAILLDTVMGECLDPVNQGIGSTAGMVKWVWDGTMREFLNIMPPQWHIDAKDAGKLYVAALVTPGVNGERIFGFGDRYSWFRVRQIQTQLYPTKEIAPIVDLGTDQTEVPNQRGEELLRGLGQNGWTSLEESVKANTESILVLEGNKA